MTDSVLLEGMTRISLEAGKVISDIYQTNFGVDTKADGSAVTQADKLAEALILKGLAELAPDMPVLAEEAASEGNIPVLGNQFFLVDPLDGTREFVNRTGEFTVNIALIRDGRPVMGVVYAPGCDKLYSGSQDTGAWLRIVAPGQNMSEAGPAKEISARRVDTDNLIAVASRSHRSPETEELLTALGAKDFTPAGSSLKFCLVAEGIADVYPRLGRTMEWDTGAGQAVLEAAGGLVNALDGTDEAGPLTYGKVAREFDNPHFIAWGKRA
ncbi:3'(2'),5'-bisphosphate nucleotidase CysQ [Parvularcula sp. IMCC14364]|uniref:3'(2'),5'-bisphosphate nucleotidase CysQ n=1 Tax=Parvularcula sp. IMCC14364 TaxID=3067902 RepID=UPI002741FEC6|nr:3'(2'),5'-bisphosphate nucleotidase CysQ [Parvularcula sp. IMCC14364]